LRFIACQTSPMPPLPSCRRIMYRSAITLLSRKRATAADCKAREGAPFAYSDCCPQHQNSGQACDPSPFRHLLPAGKWTVLNTITGRGILIRNHPHICKRMEAMEKFIVRNS
jgi:hypothetical protein